MILKIQYFFSFVFILLDNIKINIKNIFLFTAYTQICQKRQIVVLEDFLSSLDFAFPNKQQHLGMYTKSYVHGLECFLDSVNNNTVSDYTSYKDFYVYKHCVIVAVFY